MKSAGLDCYTKFVVEQERKYLDAMVSNQPELFRDDSILIESGIEFVELRNPPKVDCLVASLPCTGASKAGPVCCEQHFRGSQHFVSQEW